MYLRQVPGVETTQSAALAGAADGGGGQRRLSGLVRPIHESRCAEHAAGSRSPRDLVDTGLSVLQVQVYLADHRADTLRRVTRTVEEFARHNDSPDAKFLLASGNAGFEAATNEVVESDNRLMLVLVYVAVIALSYVTFEDNAMYGFRCSELPQPARRLLCRR